jgi:hypothetical protein
LIREALERLTRPLRRCVWNARRRGIIHFHETESSHFPPPIPCTWEERDPEEIKRDVHRWIEGVRARLGKHILIDPKTGRVATYDPETDIVDMGGMQARYAEVEEFLKKTKQDLKKKRIVDPKTGRLDMRFNPLEDTGCILLPCRECDSMTCREPEAHFGLTYEELRDGSWRDES